MTRIKEDPRVHNRRLAPVTEWKEPEPAKEKPVAQKAAPKAPTRRKAARTKGRKA